VLCVVGFVLGQIQTVNQNGGRLDIVSRAIQGLESPAARSIQGLVTFSSDFWIGVRDATSLKKEVERLRAVERASLQYQETVDRLTQRVENLNKMHGYQSPTPKTKVFARIIGYFPQQNRATLDRGEESGIKPHMPVCAADGLVGIVETVSANSCQVLLVTSPQIRIASEVVGVARVPGVVRGETSSRLAMDLFASDPVYTGEQIVTSGFSKSIPAGIPVGTVVEAMDDPQFGLRRVFVLPSVHMGSVDEVYVLK
jgi:rod shape-determining protein MreC